MNIYLDNMATTPLDPRVLEAMMPFLTDRFGNAASRSHSFGAHASSAVALAREQVAALIHADPLSIIFTSGATESINLAIKGLAWQYPDRRHLITCQTEHPAVLDCIGFLETQGFSITRLGVDTQGHLDLEELEAAVKGDTLMISLMGANNETGVLHDLEAIGRIARQKEVFFHCDGAQLVGKLPVDVAAMPIDLLSISSHKLYGPKGVGALFLRRKQPRVRLTPLIHGGGHERGLRSGTLNVPGLVGLGLACQLAATEMEQEQKRLRELRELFLATLKDQNHVFQVNGDLEKRLMGNLNLRFSGISGSFLLKSMPELAASIGSACSSAVPSPSHVLLAMGLGAEKAGESIRLGFGRFTTHEEVQKAASHFCSAIVKIKSGELSPTEENCSL